MTRGGEDARQWLRAVAGGGDRWRPEVADRLAAELAEGAPPRVPADLLGQVGPAPERHLAGLAEACRDREAAGPRTPYHARWLLHLLDPTDPRAALRVSVVIPVYGAPELATQAVESCLAQTHPSLEVVVVDDGSPEAVEPFVATAGRRGMRPGHELRVVRQRNAGAAGARTRGIEEARGDLVHLLDADDVLDPDAVERQLHALRCAPYADACVGAFRAEGMRGRQVAPDHKVPPLGDEFCPSRDLLATWVRRYPFHTSSVLAPRHLFLEVGPWDGELSSPSSDVSDAAYWLRLALRDARIVALKRPFYTRRFRPGSLTAAESPMGPILFLRALLELLDRPRRWPYLGPLLARMSRRRRWTLIHDLDDPRLDRLREALLQRTARLGEGAVEGLSGRPALALIAAHGLPDGGGSGFRGRLGAALQEARAQASEPGLDDLSLWFGSGNGATPPENAAALGLLLEWLDARLRQGRCPVTRGRLPELAARLPGHPLSPRLAALGRAPSERRGRWAYRLTWPPRLGPRLG